MIRFARASRRIRCFPTNRYSMSLGSGGSVSRTFGGTVDNGSPDALAKVIEQSGGGVAGAIDFVGSPKTMEFGINALRKGGKLVMVGLYGGAASISTVLFPFKMMTIEGSYVGTLQDLKELLELGSAGKVAPIPIETRSADRATDSLADLKAGGKVPGRVVMTH